MRITKTLSIVSLLSLLSACSSAPIVKPMPQPIAVEAWEMQEQDSESNYTEKLLEALQQ